MERLMGTSPFVGGLRGSSAAGRGLCKVAKKDERGNSKGPGEKKDVFG